MKKYILILFISIAFTNLIISEAKAETEPTVKIEIPASTVEEIDVKYEIEEQPSTTEKAIGETKEAADKTVSATKNGTKKAVDSTKSGTKKAVDATKNAAKKTAEKTKEVTNKTVDGTKNLMEDLNPNKPVTIESLQTESEIKTLKNEKNGLKSAYNSRIKDTNAKIKAAENSTTLSDVEKQNKIYTLNKQKSELETQRDNAIIEYNAKIKEAKK